MWAHSTVGSATRSQCVGQGFESPWVHQRNNTPFRCVFCWQDTGFELLCVLTQHKTLSCPLTTARADAIGYATIATTKALWSSYESPWVHHKRKYVKHEVFEHIERSGHRCTALDTKCPWHSQDNAIALRCHRRPTQ